ncbi:hypothetical protein HDG34_003295 [Paraburkholderia sp. HC6.4b]|uniref:hypothetical protein n=1 Tax=unclassified Paraburkholderia TaxID=2615204 RepID=UPI001622FD39|nr:MULTISPECIES: hypothetical protein [unclassified Paraburkholderia]MBB5409354.1 hypothetical protein [Paraburkholderia sp. HC6.4b]MBB5451082.1 hypothetical protein [Paraburkholderia sp. Kb1A]
MIKMLDRAQAEAAFSAMVAMNNVCGTVHVRMGLKDDGHLHVAEHRDGRVHVYIRGSTSRYRVGTSECYTSQNAFAKAYGLED